MDIINEPNVRASPRRQNQTTSSSEAHKWVISEDTKGEVTTNKQYIKQEENISRSTSKKPDNYADVLVDVIDMTMETTRVPIKQNDPKWQLKHESHRSAHGTKIRHHYALLMPTCNKILTIL